MCREEHKVKQISRQPLRQQPYNANKTRVPLNGAVRGSSGIASNGSLANKGGKGAVRGGGGVRVGGSPLLQNDKMIGDKGAASDVRPRAFSKPAAVPQRTNCARNGSVGAGRLGSEANIVTFKDYE